MQNLTLQLTQVNTAKKPVDYDKQSNQVADKSNESNASFATVLKKQVGQKGVKEQNDANQVTVNQRAALAKKAASKPNSDHEADAVKQTSEVDATAQEVKLQVKLDISVQAKQAKQLKVDDKDLSDAQATQDTIIAQMGLPAMLNPTQKVESTQKDNTNVTEQSNADDVDDSIALKVEVTATDEDGLSQQDKKDISKLHTDKSIATTDTKEDLLNDIKVDSKISRNDAASKATDSKAHSLKDIDVKGLVGKELNLKESSLKDTIVSTQFARPELNTTLQANASLAAQQVDKSNQISTSFGRDGWNQAVNQKVVWMVGAGDHSATLTLNPPDLGPLQVVLKMGNDHVDTTFISDNPEVRQALQDGMSMLRDKMQESGIQLGNTNVSSNEQSQRDFQQAAQNRAQQSFGTPVGDSIRDAGDDLPRQQIKQSISNGLVDTFA
jgi:flagellar hook-length control protein FliK